MDIDVPCRCKTPHEKDTITFRDRLNYEQGTAITNAAQMVEEKEEPMRSGIILAMISKFCILFGIESWTLTDDDGKPLPVTKPNVTARVLEDAEIAAYATDPVVDLYQGQVIDPLLVRVANKSQRSQMVASTSRMPRGSRTRKQSRPSSISTIPTDATEPISSSPDGAYSSSQNLELAG